MKSFIISAKVVVSVYTEVEAETFEEALEIATNERTPMSITPNGGDNKNENWMLDEIDGEPYDLYLDSET